MEKTRKELEAEIKELKERLEFETDDDLLKKLNQSLKDVKEGRFYFLTKEGKFEDTFSYVKYLEEQISKLKKESSNLRRDINRLRKTCSSFERANKLRKMQHRDVQRMMEWLINEKRVSKKELSNFLHKREDA